MKTALMSKVAMCACPTALIATTVATVPTVRRAVHHATAPHGLRHADASPKRRSARLAAAQVPCPPALLAALGPLVPDLTVPSDTIGRGGQPAGIGDFALARSFPGGMIGVGSFGGGGAGSGGGAGGGSSTGGGGTTGDGTTVTNPTTPDTPAVGSAVPEPGSWVMMVGGFMVVGGTLRAVRRRRMSVAQIGYRAAPVAALSLGGGMPLRANVGLGSMAVTSETAGVVATSATTGAKMGALAKAALCVCPPALIAGTVATVPPVRHAVYNATSAARPASAVQVPSMQPCDPSILAKPVIEASVPERIDAFSARIVSS